MDNLTLIEKWDTEFLEKCLSSKIVWDETKHVLKKILNRIENSELRCRYETKLVGRTYPKPHECLATTWNVIRKINLSYCYENPRDLDIYNCHFSTISGVCKIFGIKCPVIDYYIKNRNESLNTLQKELDETVTVTLDQLKTEFIIVLNGGSPEFLSGQNFMNDLVLERDNIIKELKKVKDLNYIMRQSKINVKKSNEKNKNLDTNFLSMICHTYENKCLTIMYQTLKEKGIPVVSLIFDGLIVDTCEPIEDVIKEMEQNIKTRLNFDIKIVEKSLELGTAEMELIEEEIEEEVNSIETENSVENDFSVKTNSTGTDSKTKTNNDKASELFEKYSCKFKLCGENIYMIKNNVWIIVEEKDIKFEIISWCKDLGFDCDGKIKFIQSSFFALLLKLTNEHNFKKKLDSYIGGIAFLNGVYFCNDKVLRSYDWCTENDIYYTDNIKRNFPTNVNNSLKSEVKQKILIDIFNDNEELISATCNFCIRRISGHGGKDFLIGMGDRDSGKSVLTDLLGYCFEYLVGKFNTRELCVKNSMESPERQNAFVESFCNSRLAIGNELPPGGKLDANTIKSVCSGGDEQTFRQAFGKKERKAVIAGMIIFLNDMSDVSNPDCLEKLTMLDLPCIFKDRNWEGTSLKIVKRADPDLKTVYIKREDVIDAFTLILLDYYTTHENYEILLKGGKEYRDLNETLDEEKHLKSLFEFDNSYQIKNSEIRQVLQNNNIIISFKKCAFYFKSWNCISNNDTNNRGWKGIRKKVTIVEEF